MNAEQARETVFAVLGQIAPEADFEELEPDVEFREQLDIDS
ncbi:MAG: acyl carrier protein, partial [Dehalococcoidia bacterium]|nr:acyl carrier protein [Dehalococcoidia bacterium]